MRDEVASTEAVSEKHRDEARRLALRIPAPCVCDKTGMFRAATERGWIPRDANGYSDDQVDAVCLLHYAMDELVPGVTASAGGASPTPPSAPR